MKNDKKKLCKNCKKKVTIQTIVVSTVPEWFPNIYIIIDFYFL